MKRILQNTRVLLLFSLFCFFAKSSFAQTVLVPGDLAIIGINNKGTTANLAVVALRNIEAGTVIKFTDKGWLGATKALSLSAADGTITLTTGTITAGTVFTFTILGGPVPSVSVSPTVVGSISIDAGWSAPNIAGNAGDAWLIYTGLETAPAFIYGLANWNTENPFGAPPDQYGWVGSGTTTSATVSYLPDDLKGGDYHGNLAGANFEIYNSYAGSFTGSKASILADIKNPANWTQDISIPSDLNPGTAGGAFPNVQPIFKIGSVPVAITSSPSTGTRGIGAAIAITINFSDNVTVTGTPRIKLNSGANAYASYTSGSNSKNLIFTYTVASGESSADLDYSTINSLALNGGSLKDPQNEDATILLPAPGTGPSLGGSSSVVIDALAPTVTAVTGVTANGSYHAGQTINLSVNFSEAVSITGTPTLSLNNSGTATYISGANSSSLIFSYLIGANQNTTDLDYASVNALALTGGTITDVASNHAVLTLPTPGGAGSLGANANLIIDTTVPTITSVTGIDGNYNIGTTALLSVNFSEPVIVTGAAPLLALNVGLPAGNATYTSGSGTNQLTFSYTVVEGQNSPDLDYTGTTALSLNGGTIKDAAGNNATLTLASPGAPGALGSSAAIVVKGTRPTVASIIREAGAVGLTKATSVNYTLTFSEAVSGVDIGDFTITTTGSIIAPSISSLSGSGTTYTVTVNTGTGSGTVRLDLISAGTAIASQASGNLIVGGYTSGQTYTIDKILPTLSVLTIASNNSNPQIARTGDVVTFSILASELLSSISVSVNGNPAIASYSGGTTYSATYTLSAADPEGPLTFAANFTDPAGNVGAAVTATTDGGKVVVDNTPTTIVSVSTTTADGTYPIGTVIPITITFTEKTNVTGTPTIGLNTGIGATAIYTGGSGTTTLNFSYTVAAGHSSSQLDYTSVTALKLAGGSINDESNTPIDLSLPLPGAVGSLSNGKSIAINGIPPTVLSILKKTPSTAFTNVNSVEYTLTFSEAVTGVDVLDFQMSIGSIPMSSITSVVGSGSTYTVTVGTGVGNGMIAINLRTSGTGITNLVSNPIQTGFGPSETYTIDKTIPTLSPVSIQSNHAGNGSIAIPGDIISLSFTSSKTIMIPVVSINGNTATVQNPMSNNWVATYTTLATDNNGQIPFNIAFSDHAGNAGLPSTTTTNSSIVTYDKTVPTLTSVTIASNNVSYPAYAKVGAMVTLLFTASEIIPSPTVTIGGATVTVLPMGGFNWMAMYAIPPTLAEGEIPFTIDYRDPYGNVGTTRTTVSSGSMVTLDKTTPTVSNVSISSNNPNPALAKPGDAVTVTFTASEGIGTPTVSFYGTPTLNVVSTGSNVWTGTYTLDPADAEGLVPFEISYSDFAGNAGIAVSTTNNASTVTYDSTLPVAPNFLGVTPGDTQNTMTWFLDADYAKYELIGGAPLVLGNTVLTTVLAANATNPMTFTQTGLTNLTTYYYALRVTDAAGNVNTSPTAIGTPLNGQTITFDQPVAAEYGSSFTINATSSSGLPVILTSNETALATVSGNTVTIVGVNSLQSVSIIATQPGDANYSYAQPVIRLLQIKPKPVTVTATAQSKVFNDVEPALAAPTVSPALVGTDVSTGVLERTAGEDAGNYEIQQNTFSLDQYKYAITYVPANFTINKKPVTITPQLAYSKTYGDDDPAFAYNFTPLVSPDVITGALARTAGEDIGTYDFDLGTLSAGTNYNLMLSPMPQFTINKSVITVTPITASIQYGDAEPVINYNHTPALKTGDAFTGALSRAAGNTPNTYLINQGTLALSNNYTLDFSPTPVNFVVLKKNISITPTAGQGKIYGDADGTINYAASPALLNGDTFSGALSRTAGTAVNNYPIEIGTLSTSNPQNYNLQLTAENYAISRKAILVNATAVSQVYGDADPVALPYTLSETLPNGDVPSGALARTPGTDVGVYPINAGNLSLGTNYDLSFTAADLTITPKAIAITPVSSAKTYGDADPAFAYNFTPLVSPDVITGTLARTAGEDIGTYDFDLGTLSAGTNYNLMLSPMPQFTINKSVITVTPITASIQYGDAEPVINYNHTPALKTGDAFTGALSRAAGNTPNTYLINQGTLALSNNYTLDFSPTPVNFVVLKKNISITPTAGQGKIYGDADGTINYAASPALLNGDTFSGALSRTAGTAVNNYPIEIGTLSTSNPQNYNLQLTAENYAISRKAILVNATAVSQVYGDADPVALPYTLSATLPNGDVPSGALARTPGTDVGVYPINAGDLSLGTNYDLSFTAADLTITPKAIAITPVSNAKTYGDADPIFTYTGSAALIGGAAYTGKLGRVAGEDVGKYALSLGDLTVSNNYTLTLNPGAELTINKKGINVIADAQSKVYGSTDPLLTYHANPALIAGDNFSGGLSREAGEHVGNYEIGQGGLTLSSNYSLNYTPANLSITAKPIAVQIIANSKTYGAADPELTYTATPLLESADVFTGSIIRAPGENKGSYLITKGSLVASADYTVNFTDANFEINPAPLTITADPKLKFVGTANPVFTGKYTGFVNGEDQSVFTTQPTYTSVATTNSPIGTYPIVASAAVAPNYQITHVDGILTVVAGAPTDVIFAGTALYENQAVGTPAGTLSSTADDPNATFTYALVSGSGDTDNALFQITGDELLTTASLNYENKKVYSVRVSSTTQHGFSLDKTFTINLSDVNEIPTLDAIANKTICYTSAGQTIDLTGISAGPDAGQNATLTVTGSNAALLQSLTVSSGAAGKGTISYRIKNGASGISTITVTLKDDGGTDQGGVDTYSRTFVLTVNALPVVSINANIGNNNNSNSTDVSKGQTLVLTASGGSTYAWAMHNSIISGQTSASLTLRPRATTTYTVTVTNANGCSEQKNFTVNVLDDLMTIKATNILTPNGDGFNDKWVIDNIDFYSNNDVKIFDKSGRLVYSKRDYDNSWDGTLNGVALTEGTYYYVIDFGKNRRRFKGFITLIREN